MTNYPGAYRARCISTQGDKITAYVPQVFGDTRVIITSRTGAIPASNSNGWVIFESAQASLPVWVSTTTETLVPTTSTEAVDPGRDTYLFRGVVPAGGEVSCFTVSFPSDAFRVHFNFIIRGMNGESLLPYGDPPPYSIGLGVGFISQRLGDPDTYSQLLPIDLEGFGISFPYQIVAEGNLVFARTSYAAQVLTSDPLSSELVLTNDNEFDLGVTVTVTVDKLNLRSVNIPLPDIGITGD